jgi:hypothetical protein
MSHKLTTVVSTGVIRNLLKQAFKLRIPGDVGIDKKQDLASRTITLPPNTDVELEYRDFRAVLAEVLDLERRKVLKIIRYPEMEAGVIGLEENYVVKVDKTSSLNFVGNFKVESREDQESHGRARVSLAWETITDPSLLPPNPDPYQTLVFEGVDFSFMTQPLISGSRLVSSPRNGKKRGSLRLKKLRWALWFSQLPFWSPSSKARLELPSS